MFVDWKVHAGGFAVVDASGDGAELDVVVGFY
jgi:hypothetical protein